MMHRRSSSSRTRFVGSLIWALLPFLLFHTVPRAEAAEPAPAATSAFNAYIAKVEARLAQQHRSQNGFVAPPSEGQSDARLRQGELMVEQLTPSTSADLPGAMLHHWQGTAFVDGAKAADFERLMKDFTAYPQHYSPQVIQAKTLSQQGDRFQASMRVRQKHVITVVMDTVYDITFGRLDAQHGCSTSRSTRISEIGSPGSPDERALAPNEEHGFLWRLNTYWSYEERDGGLYMQIESVSLRISCRWYPVRNGAQLFMSFTKSQIFSGGRAIVVVQTTSGIVSPTHPSGEPRPGRR